MFRLLTRTTAVVATLVAAAQGTIALGSEKIDLFNGKDLAGWTIWIRHPEKETDPRSDPNKIFQVKDGVLHISGQHFGALTTEKEYGDYRLKLEFKWGTKKWPPRENVVRDSGILYHCIGPDKVWTKSVECQIQEGDTGDFWMVDGTSAMIGDKREARYSKKLKDTEKPSGEWNTVEVICKGDTVQHIVNGVLVAEATGLSADKDGKEPLTRGRIMLQSEGAEVFYRNVTLEPLK